MEDEVGKYRKKKQSNTSKSKYKSKHKHEYKSCLIRSHCKVCGEEREFISIGSYCIICGKIGGNIDDSRSMTVKCSQYRCRALSKEEILEQNSDLEIFDVYGWGNKYVSLENI